MYIYINLIFFLLFYRPLNYKTIKIHVNLQYKLKSVSF